MKKMIVVIALGILCSATMFAAKGGKGGGATGVSLGFSSCGTEDCYLVTGQNLVAGKTYTIQIASNCADVTPPATITSTSPSVTMYLVETDTTNCTTGSFHVRIYLGSKLVYTTLLTDN